MANIPVSSKYLELYSTDGRRSVETILEIYQQLVDAGWKSEQICDQSETTDDKSGVKNPIIAFKSPPAIQATEENPLETFWILAGVHGEEPAPQEAFANEMSTLIELGQTEAIVFVGMLNPKGRRYDWRYENEYRDFHKGHSVTDSEHLLLVLDNNGHPQEPYQVRMAQPVCETANRITQWVVRNSRSCLPKLVVDHHEDRVPEKFPDGDPRNITSCYVYVSGQGDATMEVADIVIQALKNVGMPIADSGRTRFDEPIENGIVRNVSDGSIDEFFTSVKYFDPTKGFCAKIATDTAIVIETTIPFDGSIPLVDRVKAQQSVIRQYPVIWSKVKQS
jgi:hypothetical protein